MSHTQRTWQIGANPAITWLNALEADLAAVATLADAHDLALAGIGANVMAAGAAGDNVADDYAAIADAIADAGVGGTVIFPDPPVAYKTLTGLQPLAGQRWIGAGLSPLASFPRPAIVAPSLAGPVIEGGSVHGVTLQGLYVRGNTSSGSKGLHVASGNGWLVRNMMFDNFCDHAVHVEGGIGDRFENIFIQNALLTRTGRGAYIGAFDIAGSDHWCSKVEATASFSTGTGGIVDGWCAGIVNRSVNSWLYGCIGEISEVGIVHASTASLCHYLACRGDLNQGYGLVVDGGVSDFLFPTAYRNSRNADNGYSGILVTGGQNSFVVARIYGDSGDTVQQKNGIDDTASIGASTDVANHYLGTRTRFIRGVAENITGASPHGTAGLLGKDLKVGQGKVLAAGGLGVGNSAAAATPGSVVKKIQVFDAAGVSLGYVPVYDAIT